MFQYGRNEYRGGEEKNFPAGKLDNNGTPLNKELCDPVVELAAEMIGELTEALMPESTKMSCRRSLNSDIGARGESFAGGENLNVSINKENSAIPAKTCANPVHDQRKRMTNAFYLQLRQSGRPLDTRSLCKKESLPGSLHVDAQAPNASPSKANSPGTTSISARSLNFDRGARDENFVGGENLNVCISKENSVVVQEAHVNPAHDQRKRKTNAFYLLLKESGRPLDSRMVHNKRRFKRLLPVDAQAPVTSSKVKSNRNSQAAAQGI